MRDSVNGTYNGDTTFCPVNAYGDCPYCDQCNVCHIDDPMEDCDDWASFWESWDEWLQADVVEDDRDSFADDELRFAHERYGYDEANQAEDYDWGYNEDEGFDPYAGEYTYDC